MADKKLPADLGAALAGFDAVVATPVALPRSLTADELAGVLAGAGLAPRPWTADAESVAGARVAPDMRSALAWLAGRLAPADAVLVTGSCFTVAEALHHMGFPDLEATRTPRPAGQLTRALEEEPS
jgi:hypothetical protein